MANQKQTRPTSERFVSETLTLISERGGSRDVNLREVSRRVGCAHTNAYNYFAGFDDLLWEAFRRVLGEYGTFLAHDLDDSLAPEKYLERVVTNLAAFPLEHPGWYRFIGSDPLDMERIPADVLETVTRMKQWLFDVFGACTPEVPDDVARDAANVVLAYIDGETFNLINGRAVPGEDIGGRVVGNAMRLIRLLVSEDDTKSGQFARAPRDYPRLELGG